MTVTDGLSADGAAPLDLPESAAALFAVLHRRWARHLLFLLGQRPAGFVELQRAVPGLSPASLADRLRDLADAGLIVRHAFPGPPMTSRYELTGVGADVSRSLVNLSLSAAVR